MGETSMLSTFPVIEIEAVNNIDLSLLSDIIIES